jgi:hypothetical protein
MIVVSTVHFKWEEDAKTSESGTRLANRNTMILGRRKSRHEIHDACPREPHDACPHFKGSGKVLHEDIAR